MILVIDIGNTNIKLGVYRQDKMLYSWRLAANARTSDEYGMAIKDLFRSEGLDIKEIQDIVISSVIPNLNYTFEHMCEYFWDKRPKMVGKGLKSGISIKYDDPKEVGADRIVNSVGALAKYGAPCIVVDYGTATTFNLINDRREFLGGVICPGIKTASEAMTASAAKLPRVELVTPESIVGKSTITNMQSGIVFGFVGLTEYFVRRFREADGMAGAKVVATGGLSELIHKNTDAIDVVDRELTLNGLYEIYKLNARK